MLRIALFVLSLAAGTGAAWLSFVTRGAPTSQVASPTAAAVPGEFARITVQDILVAAVELSPGHVLTGESVRWQAWPEEALHPNHVRRHLEPDALGTLAGTVVHASVGAGEPIRRSSFVPPRPGSLSAALRPGRRAVAVRITAESTAGGFILPNDRVDVINTIAQDNRNGGERRHTSRTILRNVLVLAIDQSAEQRLPERGAKDEKAKPALIGKTATLEVTPHQAEILAAGEAMGILSLALRSPTERDEAVAALSPPPTTAPTSVRVMRGGKAETVGAAP